MRLLLACSMLLAVIAPAAAQSAPDLDGAEILALARETHGGDRWAAARTLVLEGTAVFYGAEGSEPRSRADDYRMWRVFDPARSAAHGADGKVRITARSGERLLFEVGYDGATTWNERGIVPKAEADAFWASNFGFGIIRQAGKPGFSAARHPDDKRGGHPLYLVSLTDPAGTRTLFGIDRRSHAIRYMGFATARGWHERTYDDFVWLEEARWLQARHVTLTYDGVKANEVFWRRTVVNVPVDPELFKPPAR